MPDDLYDRDILLWSEHQSDLLRRLSRGERVNDAIDWGNLIEEVESVGRSELAACESLLEQILIHLMKIVLFPESEAQRHWQAECQTFLGAFRRRYVASMRQKIALDDIWQDALEPIRLLAPEASGELPDTLPLRLDDFLPRDARPDRLAARLRAAADTARPDRE